MTEPELKPCPFCGGKNIGWAWRQAYSCDSSYAFFGCHDCQIGSDMADEDNTMHPDDVAEWNRRADLPPTLEQAKALPEIKALVEAAEYILDGMGIDAPLYEIDPDDDFLDAANSEWVSDTLRRLATALRAIGEGGE